MTELTNITQQTEVEFVNREFAESEAKRAITLLNASDESKVEAWFALQAVADQVGPASNVGVRSISWRMDGGRGRYVFSASCRDGRVTTTTGAPDTLEEARLPKNLSRAIDTLNRAIEQKGGLTRRSVTRRPNGCADALVAAVAASPEGTKWLSDHLDRSARHLLLRMVCVADAYGRNGVFPAAGLGAHHQFVGFDEREALIRAFPTASAAKAKAMSMRGSVPLKADRRIRVRASQVYKVAVRSGVSPRAARAILRDAMDGCSKTKLIRAVNEAIRMVGEDDSRGLRAA